MLAECPEMGNALHEGVRHWFLRGSRFHVYYQALLETEEILVLRLRHEKQGPSKR
jgi:plasmid stabilization system protein ParE